MIWQLQGRAIPDVDDGNVDVDGRRLTRCRVISKRRSSMTFLPPMTCNAVRNDPRATPVPVFDTVVVEGPDAILNTKDLLAS